MGKLIESDVLPVFEDKTTVRRNTFELNFVAQLGSLGVVNYLLKFEKDEY